MFANNNKPNGLACPNCSTLIPMTIESLLTGTAFVCPNAACRTVLNLDRARSRQSLDALDRLQSGLARARAQQGQR